MTDRFIDVVQQDVAEEKAGALGRSGRRLEQALERFRNYERARRCGEPRADAERETLLWDLVERVEAFVVHREACGLRDSRDVLKYFGVPREALVKVGIRRPQACHKPGCEKRRRPLFPATFEEHSH
jgi:hypothetical protein